MSHLTLFLLLLGQIVHLVLSHSTTPLTVANPNHLLEPKLKSLSGLDRKLLSFVKNVNFKESVKLMTSNTTGNISKECEMSFFEIGKDLYKAVEDHHIGQLYVLKMLDAWGKVESGIFEGNLNWPGRFYECNNVEGTNFTGSYCSIYAGQPQQPEAFGIGPPTGVHIGGCFPSTCSSVDVTNLFINLAESQNLTVQVNCPEMKTTRGFKEGLGFTIFIILLVCVAASTAYDLHHQHKSHPSKAEYSDTNGLLSPALVFDKPEAGKLHKLAISFSLITNTKILLTTEKKVGQIDCLHGMRFLSMSWVMLGHAFLFSVSFSDNLMFSARYFIDHWEFQAVANATVSVDSFFYLSGLLVAYLGLKELGRRDGKMNVPLMYLHRYLRLTPAYAFCMLFVVSLYPMLGDGPNWPGITTGLADQCQKYWWTNLLYMNNLYPVGMEEECYAWGWYLANDTQFYMLAPLLLYALYKSPRIGIALTSFLGVTSIAITGGFSSYTKQQPQVIGIGYLANLLANGGLMTPPTNSSGDALHSGDPPVYNQYISDLYTKPWCRIGAWTVGILTGYLLYFNKNQVKMPKVVVAVGWVVAAGINCAVLYGLFPAIHSGHVLTVDTAAFYNAMFRPLWCVGLAWVTVACVSGYGGPVNAILSWRGFIPLSRLTYCTYLVHPLVIWWFLGTEETHYHYSIHFIIMLFLACLVIATMMAFIVSMLVEAPFIALVKAITGDSRSPKPYKNNLITNIQDEDLNSLGEEHDA